MKKRVAIYVDEGVWLGIRKRALELGKSAGDYLVSMHLAVKADEVSDSENLLLNDEYAQEFLKGRRVEKPGKVIKPVEPSRKLTVEEELDLWHGKKPKYDQKYKDKNPNERCGECGKALRFCGC